jgi:hypothetical protein
MPYGSTAVVSDGPWAIHSPPLSPPCLFSFGHDDDVADELINHDDEFQ